MNPLKSTAAIAAVVAFALSTAGCASLPDTSTPQAVGTVPGAVGTNFAEPTPGAKPEALLRDFIRASGDPTDRHAAARRFLLPGVAQGWDDAGSVTLIESVDVVADGRTGDNATFVVRAHKVGELRSGGIYKPDDSRLEVRVSLAKADGEWRVSSLPPGVLVERSQFLNTYQRRTLYYFNAAGQIPVPDQRWISVSRPQTAGALMALLVGGPRDVLRPALENALEGVSIRGDVTNAAGESMAAAAPGSGVRIDLGGLGNANPDTRRLAAAQIVWTLAKAEVSGPYVILADGEPLDPAHASGWSTTDVSEFDPVRAAEAEVGLHALAGGQLVTVNGSRLEPVPGYFGSTTSLRSAAINHDGSLIAAVSETGRSQPEPARALMLGGQSPVADTVVAGSTISRPTWTADGATAWAVVDGRRVIAATRDRNNGAISLAEVDTHEFNDLPGSITELRLARDGVRAALIIDGKVYLATVVPQSGGGVSLTAPRQIARELGSAALALDWATAETIVIARATSDVPVLVSSIDGARLDALPTRNLEAPVLAIDASQTTEFVVDARSVYSLNNNDSAGDREWREVPGLAGTRAIPVLPG
ncbi:MtrAB system accessory lipoprotein LpqB [Smaragdicoccus niigatensis]|uniref:MtrAB system accessory lipoprotein LpqB n=1 Tax=Smaragdicoccus niigatensis TaxID=359359 RepID=UPI00037925A1|nr:MtrAB system accessory lipoprotein LpqB [Smaragdicoccus niigatensis]